MKFDTVKGFAKMMGTEQVSIAEASYQSSLRSCKKITIIEVLICAVILGIKFLIL